MQLIELLGGESMVAEMTGRAGGLTRDSETGRVKYQARNSEVRPKS